MNIVLTVTATLVVAVVARLLWLRYFPPGYAITLLSEPPKVHRGAGPGVLLVEFRGEVEPFEVVSKPGELTATLSAEEAREFVHRLLWALTQPVVPGDERPVNVTLAAWQAEWLIERLEKFAAGWPVEHEVLKALYGALGKKAPVRW